jgi:hypothetical protein
MRRRPQTRGTSSTRRAAVPVNANPGEYLGLLALLCDRDFSLPEKERGQEECSAGPGTFLALAGSQELLHYTIDRITERFAEAQAEYRLVTANSPDAHKWKGEMIAYANVVALLEDLKSHCVPAE